MELSPRTPVTVELDIQREFDYASNEFIDMDLPDLQTEMDKEIESFRAL